jgi:hypothetical protein
MASPRSIQEANEVLERVFIPWFNRRCTVVPAILWYQGLSQEEAAELLGMSSKTIGRRWREARLTLGQAMED